MSLKKTFKRILILSFMAFMALGIYAAVKNLTNMKLFKVSSVEIRGVMNADREKLSVLSKKLIGLSVFEKDMEKLLKTDDPWVQKITAQRSLPDNVNIMVYEEKPLFSFQDEAGKCYYFTAGNKKIKTVCDGVNIKADKSLTDAQAAAFGQIVESNSFLKTINIALKNYSFIATIDGDTIYCPYDSHIFKENFQIYKSSVKKRYKYVEYVDITIGKRIFVKGARNESSKG